VAGGRWPVAGGRWPVAGGYEPDNRTAGSGDADARQASGDGSQTTVGRLQERDRADPVLFDGEGPVRHPPQRRPLPVEVDVDPQHLRTIGRAVPDHLATATVRHDRCGLLVEPLARLGRTRQSLTVTVIVAHHGRRHLIPLRREAG
jgi:hypothetical protein